MRAGVLPFPGYGGVQYKPVKVVTGPRLLDSSKYKIYFGFLEH